MSSVANQGASRDAYLRAEVEDEDRVELVVDLGHGEWRDKLRTLERSRTRMLSLSRAESDARRQFADKIDAQ